MQWTLKTQRLENKHPYTLTYDMESRKMVVMNLFTGQG